MFFSSRFAWKKANNFFVCLFVDRWAIAIGFIQQINNSSNDNMNWSLTLSGVVLNTLYALSHLLSTYYLPDTRNAMLNMILQLLTKSLYCPGGDKHSARYCPHSIHHTWGCLQATVGEWRVSVHSSSEEKRLREGVRWSEGWYPRWDEPQALSSKSQKGCVESEIA